MKTIVRSLVVLTGALALAACGGSSSSGGGTTPPGNVARDTRGAITAVNPAAHTITVNNKTVTVQGAAIVDDTVTVGEDRLTVGTVVAVRGDFTADDRSGTAAHVEIEHGLEGTVDDKGTDFIRVGGQLVNVDDSTHFEDSRRLDGIVKNSTKVRISGVPDDSGGLRASRVDGSPRTDGGDDVKGFVSGLSGKSFELRLSPDSPSCWSVDASGIATLPAGVANGAFVEVHTTSARGAPAGACALGTLVASSIHVEDRFSESEVEVEGIVTSGTSSDFVVDGTSVHTTTSTTWQLGAPADLVVGAKVEAEGSLSNGVLQARKVSFRPGARLTAIVDSVQADSITVLGMRVQKTSFTRPDVTPVAGDRVEVRGNPSADGTGLVAYRFTDPGGSRADERVLLRALVSEKSSGATSPTFTLMGFLVTPQAGASYRGISAVSGQDGPPISATDFWNRVEAGHTVIKVRARTAADVNVPLHTFSAEELELEGNDG